MFNIKAKNLCKTYSGKCALNGCSFEVEEGNLIGVLGANGAGKSTLIKILAGVLEPDQGDALLNGCSITKNRRSADLLFLVIEHPFNNASP